MFNLIKSILRFTRDIVFALALFIVFYFLFAFALTWIPANMFSKQPEKGITIYIKSNGVHTDLLLPTTNKLYDWTEKIIVDDFPMSTGDYKWTSFGWGDKGFYLHTPDWADLKFSTAFNAMFLLSTTAMHISLHETVKENTLTKKITLTEDQYLVLCDYVLKSFQRNEDGTLIRIDAYHYKGVNDNFYEAEGKYHLFHTCNNWANSGLKTAGVKTAYWAPFDKCIFYHFE